MYYLSVVMAVVTLEPVDSLVDNGTVCGQSSGKLETAQLISTAKTNMLFVLKEKDEKVQKLSSFYESALLDKEQTIQSLQLRIASLNSQVNEYKKQLTVIQEESRMKDHLLEQTNQELACKLYRHNATELREQLDIKLDQLARTECKIKDDTATVSLNTSSYHHLLIKLVQESKELQEEEITKMKKALHGLEERLERKDEIIQEQLVTIDEMGTELKVKTLQLLDIDIAELQTAISEKDTAIGLLEMKCFTGERLNVLQKDKVELTKELKSKIQEKLLLSQDDERHKQSDILEHSSVQQIREEIRVIWKGKAKFKGYIDHLLGVALDTDPELLEGLPRVQQSPGMSPDLLERASLTELVEELQEEKDNMYSLQSYAASLLQRLSHFSPELLNSFNIID